MPGRKLRWTLGILALLLVVALAAPFLVPVSRFIPEIERVASQKLGQPVEIAELRLSILPTPRVVAHGIRVGKADLAKIGELEIVPELKSFLSGPRALRLVRAQKVELEEAALGIPGAMPKGAGGEALELRRLVLKQVQLKHSKVKLPEFDLEADLGPGYSVEQARFESRDGLKARLAPQGGGISSVELEGRNWTLPVGAPLTFERLLARGRLRGEQLDLPDVEAALYGGTLTGHVRVDWAKQWQIGGEAKIAGVDLVPVQRALAKPARLSGRLKAEPRFSAQAKSPELLGAALALDGPFEVVGGAYQGVDLSKVADITGSKSAEDATHFEQFTGKLELRGERVRINELCVRSPKLQAGGFIQIEPDETLSGRLDVALARTSGFVSVPVALSGKASDPTIRPTNGYVLGAVVGSVLLPGIGTAGGASVGSRIEGGAGGGCK